MLVDSHCHLDLLDLTAYQGDLNRALQAAVNNGVEHLLCVCVELRYFSRILEIALAHDNIDVSVGLHPSEAVEQEPSAEDLIALASHPKVVALGETGLDYYRCQGDMTWQQERFRQHIRAARAVKKPLIIHTRQAQADTLRILREENAESVGGVMHCFTETWEMAEQAMALGFYISFSGIVTFQNAKDLQAVAKKVPLERMLIETDSPFLAPVPFRGKPNEPAHVKYVAQYLAELKQIDLKHLAEQTTQNFYRLFKS
ncbi:MAG: TatD family hydrolase [Gammaproteobacteria bacterium]